MNSTRNCSARSEFAWAVGSSNYRFPTFCWRTHTSSTIPMRNTAKVQYWSFLNGLLRSTCPFSILYSKSYCRPRFGLLKPHKRQSYCPKFINIAIWSVFPATSVKVFSKQKKKRSANIIATSCPYAGWPTVKWKAPCLALDYLFRPCKNLNFQKTTDSIMKNWKWFRRSSPCLSNLAAWTPTKIRLFLTIFSCMSPKIFNYWRGSIREASLPSIWPNWISGMSSLPKGMNPTCAVIILPCGNCFRNGWLWSNRRGGRRESGLPTKLIYWKT